MFKNVIFISDFFYFHKIIIYKYVGVVNYYYYLIIKFFIFQKFHKKRTLPNRRDVFSDTVFFL